MTWNLDRTFQTQIPCSNADTKISKEVGGGVNIAIYSLMQSLSWVIDAAWF